MTIKELQFIDKILNRIKYPDEQVNKAKSFINKDLASYAARKGQLREQYEYEYEYNNY